MTLLFEYPKNDLEGIVENPTKDEELEELEDIILPLLEKIRLPLTVAISATVFAFICASFLC
ncbi:hypothetical protein J7E73_27615 [Paenibacillus albidus]|uniref:hypothetical protein n=1 Tax=Paenibacillus albidus TaxID=2041023 RepID=UPI001BEBEE6A|nr:hypothetical protein [Paenibacillus albidus]MBT2292830.1 hypothetical protein [Paenibacillus albidus]